MRAALKVIPPISLCWLTTSEVNTGGMAVKVEPTHQYSITCCCRVTDGSREAVWQNGIWHGSAYGAKMWHWIPPCRKNGTHWHSSMLAESLWRPNSGCEHSEGWVVHFSSGWNISPPLVQIYTAAALFLTTCVFNTATFNSSIKLFFIWKQSRDHWSFLIVVSLLLVLDLSVLSKTLQEET